jgi:hypothetical protein
MTRRKGEVTARQIERGWPHQVAFPPEAVRGVDASMAMHTLAKELGAAPRPIRLQHDGRDRIVFCFAMSESAQAFWQRFGGERLTD